MKKICLLLAFLPAFLQAQTFTHADTLRGSVTPERSWWDARHYDLHVAFDADQKTVSGWNTITYEVLTPGSVLQIDLMEPLVIDSAVQDGRRLDWKKDGDAWFIQLPSPQPAGSFKKIAIHYHGQPVATKNPPWDGGVIWSKDAQGRPWISVACQGVGPSIWYPNKDHQYDEPDSAALHITTPPGFKGVANGRMRYVTRKSNGSITWSWAVVNPINNYNLIPYVGHYAHFKDVFEGENGPLDLDFWVLDYNQEKAKQHFLTETPKMLRCFEHWFGPYPFYEDGFKLVESPHLGMEHQSAIAYGNGYLNGYRGRDLSGTGVGLKWDFILVHESGHEWFGNNISTKDIADMWVHESFTNYSETLYTGCEQGEDAATTYNVGCRKLIRNDQPIIGTYGVNREGSGDMYYKGGALIHTLRAAIGDDEKFRQILRGLNETFRHQTVTTKQVEDYFSEMSEQDFSKVFDQYLRSTNIPVLEIKFDKKASASGKPSAIDYRWTNCVPGFNLPLRVQTDSGEWELIHPTEKWKSSSFLVKNPEDFKVDERFYVKVKSL
jgi:aminopeptidase N